MIAITLIGLGYPFRRRPSRIGSRYCHEVARTQTRGPSVADVQRVAALRVAVRAFERGTERAARAAGLTPQWYLLLLLVKGSENGDERATVGELARRLHLAQSTVTELVNRVERSGSCVGHRRRPTRASSTSS